MSKLRRGIFALLILGLALLFLIPIVAMSLWMAFQGSWMMGSGLMGPGMMGWRSGGYGVRWVPMLAGPVLILVFIGLIVFGAYYLLAGHGIAEPRRDRSLEILRERFAKGEISEEQFRKMREELRG